MIARCDCCGRTDIGERRSNQDHFLIADLITAFRIGHTSIDWDDGRTVPVREVGKLLAVADGMGGHAAGELASRLVIQTIAAELSVRVPLLSNVAAVDDASMIEVLNDVLQQCQSRLLRDAASHPGTYGMGTTLTLACVDWPRLFIAHVGDSRAYLFREGRIAQLTTDHTLAAQAVAAGVCGPDDPMGERMQHVLLNCIGANRTTPRLQFRSVTLQPDDVLLLCTDGLLREGGNDRALQDAVSGTGEIAEMCDRLVDSAKARGARDNITAVVARFTQAVPAESERGSSPGGMRAVDPNIARLKSTSDFPQQFVA
jgi:protein phosphatase